MMIFFKNSSYRANSQRANNSVVQNESTTQKRVETSSNAVQTDLDTLFLALNKTYRKGNNSHSFVIPYLCNSTVRRYFNRSSRFHLIVNYSPRDGGYTIHIRNSLHKEG